MSYIGTWDFGDIAQPHYRRTHIDFVICQNTFPLTCGHSVADEPSRWPAPSQPGRTWPSPPAAGPQTCWAESAGHRPHSSPSPGTTETDANVSDSRNCAALLRGKLIKSSLFWNNKNKAARNESTVVHLFFHKEGKHLNDVTFTGPFKNNWSERQSCIFLRLGECSG